MAKMIKATINNMFGIKFRELNGKSIEISGTNAAGKTSIPDAVIFGLKNYSKREYIIKKGETEGEIVLEFDTGLTIDRKVRTEKAPYKDIRENGKVMQAPEAFLNDFVTELQLNPIAFIGMDTKEQNRMILDMIDFKWDLKWIEDQFGEIVPGINWEQNILKVLHDIQADEGHYFMTRQDLNREARNKLAFIEEIGSELPEQYSASAWEKVDLSDLYTKIEKLRAENNLIEKAKTAIENSDNKKRSLEADLMISVSAIDKAAVTERNNNDKSIQEYKNMIKELETKNANIEKSKITAVKLAESEHKSKVAEFEANIKQYESQSKKETKPVDDLVEEADNAEKMKAFINEYYRMVGFQNDVNTLKEESEELTVKIEKARTLPGEILQNCKLPIEGLSIVEGKPLINGLPISNLSDGEKLNLCVDIVVQNPKKLQIILIDGVEKLSEENAKKLYKKLKDKKIQFIATRVTSDNELIIREL